MVVALQIAYLPVLYAAYNRRETLVTMLEGLAGTPGWGPEVLVRSAAVDNLDGLGSMYDRWMQWAADVSESHSAYLVLMYFRSPNARRSWVISLLSILDAAAMHLALCPITVPAPARNLMRIGYLAFRQLAATIGVEVNEDPSPDDDIQLTKEEFVAGRRACASVRHGVRARARAGVAALQGVARQLRGGGVRARRQPRRRARAAGPGRGCGRGHRCRR